MKDTKTQLVKPTELTEVRYVEPSGIDREEMKRICEESGVVWGVN